MSLRGAAIAIAVAACSAPAKPPPTTIATAPTPEPESTPEPEPTPDVDVDIVAKPVIAAERVWLKPTAVSWPTDRRKAQFHGLGGGSAWSVAIAVSADGSTPVGIARPTGGRDEAVRWQNGTMSPLETLDLDGDDSSTPYALSRDGTIVAGESTATNTGSTAVVWRADGKATRLALPTGADSAVARAVSRDGRIIAGCAGGGCDSIVRWQGGKVKPLALDAPLQLAAHAMSEDGNVFAGTRGTESEEAVRITATGAVESRGAGTHVEGISDDGTVMVGNIDTRAVLWRGKSAPLELGVVEGYDECYARAVSADGGRVIGNCIRRSTRVPTADEPRQPPPVDPHASVAFVWDKRHGMRSVADALAAAGVKLPDGWWLDEAFDICGYGVTIVGDAHSPSSDNEAWMVILPR